MLSEKMTITNEQGMHMRPATVVSQAMMPFASDVTIEFDGNTFDAKSMMALMTSCLKCGSEVEIRAEGPDEEEAFAKLKELIETGMGD